MFDIIAMGELLIDFTMIGADEKGYPVIAAHPGGAPANYLAAANKIGCSTAFIGKVGNDTFGNKLIATLDEIGTYSGSVVKSDDYFTTLAFVTLDESGNREFSFSRKLSADIMLRYEEIDLSVFDGARLFHFGTLSLTDDPVRSTTCRLVEYAKSRGVLVSFDPNLRKPLWASLDDAKKQMLYGLSNADIVKISDEEVAFLWGITPEEGAEIIINEFGVKLVFVTCGADGAVFANSSCTGSAPGIKGLKIVDTTGAGDIFGGTAAGMILKSGKAPETLAEAELKEITTYACAAASVSATKPGGIFSVPEASEIKQVL